MLDNHPQLAVANDAHFIPKGIKKKFDGIDPLLTSAQIERVLHYRKFHRLDLPMEEALKAAKEARTYGGFVSSLYSAYSRLRGKEIAGEKAPYYVKHLPLLHGLFPWVRTIHIIRDGRDVALSTLEWAVLKTNPNKGPARYKLWLEEPVAVCALWWCRKVSTGRRDGAVLGPLQYLEMRYEELVARPEEVLRDIATFLELPFAPQMVTYYKGKTRFHRHHRNEFESAKKAWLPPTPGLRDWRKEMKERDVALFEAIAGDLLSELGYKRAIDRIPPQIVSIAERCLKWWEQEGKSVRKY